MLYYRIDRNYC